MAATCISSRASRAGAFAITIGLLFELLPGLLLGTPAFAARAQAGESKPIESATPPSAKEDVVLVSMLDFELASDLAASASKSTADRPLLSWWRTTSGKPELEERDGAIWIVTREAARIDQPIAAYAPLVDGLVIRGRVRGAGRVAIVDGTRTRAERELVSPAGADLDFEITGKELAESAKHALVPRLTLELGPRSRSESAVWSRLEVLVPMPCPSEAELAREIEARLHEALDPWIEHGLDHEGTRTTALAAHVFDAIDGSRLGTYPAALHPLFEALLIACELSEDARWHATLDQFASNYLELCIHPTTNLPRLWDTEANAPLDDRMLEVAAHLRFVLDLSERGPLVARAKASDVAHKMAETVLAKGVMPDGELVPIYLPSDGTPSSDARQLRRLDLPAQIVRVGKSSGDERFRMAAEAALAALEYRHYWPGDWHMIDPGFDDDFGHYGARAVTMLAAFPSDKHFRRFAVGGFVHYAPLWRDAMRFGGSIAADQVRDWDLLAELAALDEGVAKSLPELFVRAVRSHLKGEQYADGSFGDVTFFAFTPRVDLIVGDLPGLPANLLRGLGIVYEERFGLRTKEIRAIYTAVLRSTVAAYRRPYGFISTQREVRGHNDAGGSLRLAPGLLRMLAALKAPAARSR